MVWSGSSPLAVVRDGMWALLLVTGMAWLAIGWSVLRLEPTDIVGVAGPVVLFGAVTEAVRACAGTRTWWLNAGMAALFAVTGIVLLAEQDTSYTTPAALIGWYLMVRGAADVAVSMMTRDTDRVWSLLMVVGVLETGLGFFAAGPLAHTADLVVVILGGLGVLRGLADLVTSLRLREVRALRADVLELPPERAAGVAGYTAGLADYDAAPARSKPRHRATSRSAPSWSARNTNAGAMEPDGPVESATAPPAGGAAGGMAAAGYTAAADTEDESFHEQVLRTTTDLDAMLALAGVTGAGVGAHLGDTAEVPQVPDTPEGVAGKDSPSAAPATDAPSADAAITAGGRRPD